MDGLEMILTMRMSHTLDDKNYLLGAKLPAKVFCPWPRSQDLRRAHNYSKQYDIMEEIENLPLHGPPETCKD